MFVFACYPLLGAPQRGEPRYGTEGNALYEFYGLNTMYVLYAWYVLYALYFVV